MQLEQAQEKDFAEIVELANIAYRKNGEGASWNVETGILEGSRLDDSLLREELAAKPDSFLLTWRDGEALMGTVWLTPEREGTWHLGLLTVRPELQNKQRGRELLNEAEVFAKQRGARRMKMTVLSVRDALISWYQRRGYRETGVREPFPYGDNRFGKPLRDDLYFVVLEKTL